MSIHPIFVHFAVGLLVAALALELIGWLFRKDSLLHAGWWNLLGATLAAGAAVISGRAAAAQAPHDEAVHALMEAHELRGFIIFGIGVVLVVFRALLLRGAPFAGRTPGWRRPAYLLLFLLVTATLFSGAGMGGKLVYEHGVGVMTTGAVASPGSEKASEDGHGDHDHGHDGN